MAMLDICHILRIKVLEDSAECGVFVIKVFCGEPLLLRFWCRKPPFCNGQVEQTDMNSPTVAEVDFVLRALHRAPNLPNSHYWGPFVLSLCLDALPFRFRLPARAHSSSKIQDIMEECGELTLLRWETEEEKKKSSFSKPLVLLWTFCRDSTAASVTQFLALNDCIYSTSSALVSLASTVVSHAHPPWPAMYVHPKTNRHNITGFTAHTIAGRALGALWWARHTITQCGEEDERTAAETRKLEEHS